MTKRRGKNEPEPKTRYMSPAFCSGFSAPVRLHLVDDFFHGNAG